MAAADERALLLRYVDPYGDTVLNSLQIVDFLVDWHRWAEPLVEAPDDRTAWNVVGELARRCANEAHLYLRFVGD